MRAAHQNLHSTRPGLAARDGVGRVQQQIQQNLRNGARIAARRRRSCCAHHGEVHRRVAPLRAYQPDGFLGERRDVDRHAFHPRRTRELEKLAQDAPHALTLLRRACEMTPRVVAHLRVALGDTEKREHRRERIADFVGNASRETTHCCEALGAVETAARETQFGVDVAQLGNRLLERGGAALQRLAHHVERGGHLGRLARPLDGQPQLEAALPQRARRGGEALERRDHAAAEQRCAERGEHDDVEREQCRDQRERRGAQPQRRRTRKPRHDHVAAGHRRCEADRLPRCARLHQRRTAFARVGGESLRRRVDPFARGTNGFSAAVRADPPPSGARHQRAVLLGQCPRFREQRTSQQIAQPRLVVLQQQVREHDGGREHHEPEARHHFGEQPASHGGR